LFISAPSLSIEALIFLTHSLLSATLLQLELWQRHGITSPPTQRGQPVAASRVAA
jgi:hypothetical protein